MAKAKKCDGQCEVNKKVPAEEPVISDWGGDDEIEEWHNEFMYELIEENDELEIALEASQKKRDSLLRFTRAILAYNIVITLGVVVSLFF